MLIIDQLNKDWLKTQIRKTKGQSGIMRIQRRLYRMLVDLMQQNPLTHIRDTLVKIFDTTKYKKRYDAQNKKILHDFDVFFDFQNALVEFILNFCSIVEKHEFNSFEVKYFKNHCTEIRHQIRFLCRIFDNEYGIHMMHYMANLWLERTAEHMYTINSYFDQDHSNYSTFQMALMKKKQWTNLLQFKSAIYE
jgi:hypothetical protein